MLGPRIATDHGIVIDRREARNLITIHTIVKIELFKLWAFTTGTLA